jgi:hypothetical protein
MNLSKKFHLILAFICSLVPSLAYADKILDKVEVVQGKNETEIHIEFLTQVRYLRHAPSNIETSRVQIFLEFPQFTKETLSDQREFRNSPKTNLVPSFNVNYPEQNFNSIGVRFKTPIKFTITPDNSGRGIVIHVPNDKSEVVAESVAESPIAPVVDHGPQGEILTRSADMSDNDYAAKLMAEARASRGVGDYPKAVQLLNVLLGLPGNTYSQDAQELIANSREKMGEMTKAKAEYETYLKLYPEGEGATRVRQRLTALEGSSKFSSADVAKTKKPIRDIHENTVYGSWNQYYYDAHSHNYPGSGKNTGSHDQSQLVSALDLTARFRQNEWDSRIVVRDTQTMDFLPNKADRNRLQVAYVEVQNKESDFMTRIGRQNGNSGGVLGRFDGGLFRYGLSPKFKLNFVTGALDEYNVDYKRHFYGINLDIGPIGEKWNGNAFFIEQRVDDLIDRRGVGGELRYFDMGKSIYSMVDYDTYFNRLNTAMLQGNWQPAEGTSYNILMETRKSPVLQMINALFDPAFQNQTFYPSAPTSLRQALQIGSTIGAPNTLTVSGLRDYAINQTLDTSLFLVGATRQMTPRWQLGGDVQVSRVTGSAGASNGAIALAEKAAADNGTFLSDLDRQNLRNSFAGGNTYTYHVQAVGLNTLFKDDTSIISVSYVDGPTSRVQSLVLTNVMVPRDKWRLDSSVKMLRIESDPASVQYVVGPTIRASYRLNEKATLEAEVGVEVTNENSSDSFNPGHTRTFRDFSFIGYRLDI